MNYLLYVARGQHDIQVYYLDRDMIGDSLVNYKQPNNIAAFWSYP